MQADERNVAETLGLLQKENGNQPLFLFHMPPLPAAPKQADTKDLSQQRHRLLAASSSNSQSSTPALTDFPPGNVSPPLRSQLSNSAESGSPVRASEYVFAYLPHMRCVKMPDRICILYSSSGASMSSNSAYLLSFYALQRQPQVAGCTLAPCHSH